MLSASITVKRVGCIAVAALCASVSDAQENTPFSRYGLGDAYPAQPVAARAMGGLSAAFIDGQSVNSANPASYGYFNRLVTYDLGLSLDSRTMNSRVPQGSFRSANLIPAYLQIGIPLNSKKGWGAAFGLKPVTRISYNVHDGGKLNNEDSIAHYYEGNGGLNQAFIGLGKRWKNFSIGVNGGFYFGRKNISTRTLLTSLHDTADVRRYYTGNAANTVSFHGAFAMMGVQYQLPLKTIEDKTNKTSQQYFLRLGATGSLKQKISASQDISRETLTFDPARDNDTVHIDSVYRLTGKTGKIQLPASYTAGIMLGKSITNSIGRFDQWLVGIQYESTKWTDFRLMGEPDKLRNSWMLRAGGQLTPDALRAKNFWSRTTYRLGFYTGKDYIDPDGNGLKITGLSFGFGFNLRKQNNYNNQFTQINTSFELGKRGSNVNNITENFFKFSIGLSLSDIWFIKKKYD